MEDMKKPRTSRTYPPTQWRNLISEQIDIPSLIKELKDYGQTTKQTLNRIIDTSQHIFYHQPNILHLESPMRVVGDIHGQFHDLLYIFQQYGEIPEDKFLFLGDYVDRGLFCIQVITLLLALKCKFPKSIYLLRGNHEGKTMTQHFNFKLQCVKKYDSDVYDRFLQLFCKLPLCALVDNKYFCVHGGISPQLKKLKQLDTINRFKEIQQSGVMCDLLWSDPSNSNSSIWEKNKIRSCSYTFSKKQATRFLGDNKIEMIIRGHQVQTRGFSYQFDDFRKKLTLTIFSAPNYCNTYKNKAGIAIIRKNCLTIESFSQVPAPFVFPNYMNVFEWSLPIIATKTSKLFLHLLKAMDKIDENSLSEEQIQVLNKLECLKNILQDKKQANFQLLQTPHQNSLREGDEEYESVFSYKKVHDKCQKYPHLPPPVIGPKHIVFKKIKVESLQAQEISPT